VKERDAGLGRQAAHVAHLEDLVAVRERLVQERDAQLAAADAARESAAQALAAASAAQREAQHKLEDARAADARREGELTRARTALASLEGERRNLEAALKAQERLIEYQHGFHWWLRLPWLRMRLGWQRWRAR
jgi:chromosome segregation ATPase